MIPSFSVGRVVRPRRASTLTLGACLIAALQTNPAAAAQTDVDISKPAATATPRLVGPPVVAANPGSPFLHTIGAIGQAPLTFMATGLPAGLSLDSATGTISGTTPAAGTYPVAVSVMNASGSASATLSITSGPTLSLTPPMGWNSYDSYGGSVNEAETLAAAQAIKTYLQPYGYSAVVVDFLWYDPEQNIDANGRYLPSPSRFPSAAGGQGFKPLADKIHALGLSFGIHIMRGIPRKSVTANSPISSSASTASQAGDTNDPCPWDNHMWGVHGDNDAGKAWYDSILKQYADWGVDFIKVDDMVNPYSNPLDYHGDETDAIRAAIDKTGRSIVLSLSPGPMQTRDAANLTKNANMWRMVNDFWDTKGLSNISDVFNAAGNWQSTQGLAVGHWPDADMLPLGYVGPRCPVHAAGPSALSHNQQVLVMSLWSIIPSPLMFGGNPTKLNDDEWSRALLTNEEVLAVNQDASGSHGKRLAKQGNTEVWSRDLARGRKAVALFNRGTDDAMVSVSFADLGITDPPTVRDLWHRSDVAGMTSGISVMVPHEAALMYTVSPPGSEGGSGAGGSSAGGGAGAPASAGAAGAALGGAGTTGMAGTQSNDSGGGPVVSASGASAIGGTNGAAPPGSDSGCSCSVPTGGRGRAPLVGGLAALLLLATARRRTHKKAGLGPKA